MHLNQNKRQFIEAVKLMAPGNKFIADVARRVPQEMLPAVAGVAAFELASTLELLCKSWRLRRPLEAPRAVGNQRSRGGTTRRNGSAAWKVAERVPIINLQTVE